MEPATMVMLSAGWLMRTANLRTKP